MKRFGQVSHVAVTGSTNDDMARILGEEQARGLTLVADYQKHGAGRRGRAWMAPAGSALLCTIALPDPLPTANLWAVPFWAALLVRAAFVEAGVEPVLQWPNDVLIGECKAAGILCVSRVTGEYAWTACGIGANVLRPRGASELDNIVPAPAFLSDYVSIDRDALLQLVLKHADALYDELSAPERIVRDWERAANLPGARYRIALDGESETFDGTALRLLPGGALLVESGGARREVSLADARVLR